MRRSRPQWRGQVDDAQDADRHPFALAVRIVLFTVFPSAFIAFFPTEVVRNPNLGGVLVMLAAAAAYAALALVVFDRGLRRYRSGNRVLELR